MSITWGTTTDFSTITNLNSLGDGNIWQSGEMNDPSPSSEFVRISYELTFATAGVAGDYIGLWIASGDEAAANEIWDGGIGTSEGAISTAAAIAEALAAVGNPMQIHGWRTSHGTVYKGHFVVYNFGPSWQLLIRPVGSALAASTNRVRYRYGTIT